MDRDRKEEMFRAGTKIFNDQGKEDTEEKGWRELS